MLQYELISKNNVSEVDQILNKYFLSQFRSGYGRFGPLKTLMPERFKDFVERIFNFKVLPDDIWIVTHPKTVKMPTLVEYSPKEGDLGQKLNSDFTSKFRTGYINANGVILPERFRVFGQRSEDFQVRDTDVWVVSFPKTGTTWTQEMCWCLNENLDYEGAKVPLPIRFPFLDHCTLFDYTTFLETNPEVTLPLYVSDSLTYIDELPSPRYIKTHLPWQLLPRQITEGQVKPKIIYVSRNAKDTCVSYYHHCVLLEGYKGSFEDFCKLFLNDTLCFAPFWEHILSFWERRNDDNVLFIKYEDMKKDLPSVVNTAADFLGKSYSTDQLEKLCDHLSFDSMKNNRSVNYEEVVEFNKKYNLIEAEGNFMRSGSVGNFKAKMSPEIILKFDEWTKKKIEGSGLDY